MPALQEAGKMPAPQASPCPGFSYATPAGPAGLGEVPTSFVMPHETPAAIKDILRRARGLLVVADEVYHFLGFGAPPSPALATFAGSANVISLGSFSKILAPGLRLGWILADAEKIRRFAGCGLLDSGGGLNPFTSAIVGALIESGGLERNVARLNGIYRARSQAMGAALKEHLPGAEFVPPQGGYFYWVRLPGVDTAALQAKANALQVNFRPGARFSSQGGLNEYMRLSYVYYEPAEVEEGLARLQRCLEQV
jgi:DNA-binding transcriptional MocR family regulator